MKILICNVGSTSLKYQLFDMEQGEKVLASGRAERVGTEKSSFYHNNCMRSGVRRKGIALPSHREAISEMLDALLAGAIGSLEEISCVGFKVVHGGPVTGTQFLTEDILIMMESFNSVAPAHNPPYIAAIRQFRELMPETPLIGSFETAFHAAMPPEAYLYSIPLEISQKYDIRRYGFHGASHEYLTSWVSEKMGRNDLRIISCHLGGSGSLAAVKNGASIDTSMGMSLQCGVLNNNRIGDMDPYVIFYLYEKCRMSLSDIKTMLQTESGLFRLSGGISNDLRDIEAAADSGNKDAGIALNAYAYTVKKYIGSYVAALGGVDAIVFGGGIGQNSSKIRKMALDGLECMGIVVDDEKNLSAKAGDDISADESHAKIYVVETNEELIVARKAMKLLRWHNTGGRER